MEKIFGLLGEKLAHSFSPRIHKDFGFYDYTLFPVPRDGLDDFFRRRAFSGLNVTVPYKKAAIKYCSALSPEAERIGSVNTVTVRADGTLYGHNTDYFGFSHTLQSNGIEVNGKKIAVLGNGGTAAAVKAVLRDAGAAEILTVRRNSELNSGNLYAERPDVEIIVNTTPVGMFPDNGSSPLDLTPFSECGAVLDVIFNPLKTELLVRAAELNKKAVNGLEMLVFQAAESCACFCGEKISGEAARAVLKKLDYEIKNIVLTGMPGCGKTAVGKIIAEKTGKKFIDTDEMISARENKDPARIIVESGERHFRKIESEICIEAGKLTGSIIATGGGAVLDANNIRALRRNGVIIFIGRGAAELEKKDRPLSADIDALYAARYPLYKKYADFTVENINSAEETAEKIIKITNN